MSHRSRAREVALQILFQDELNPPDSATDALRFVRARLHSSALVDLAWSLICGVRQHRVTLDALLEATATNWSLRRMANTDRNVLRLGAYEMLHTDTPDRVVINEAVELAKRFGTGLSAPFVNGVLDQLLHEHRG
ncbi:MAG: transcription antitermination factor NusB, partial [Planctomycetes bacterium RBG_16_64_10]